VCLKGKIPGRHDGQVEVESAEVDLLVEEVVRDAGREGEEEAREHGPGVAVVARRHAAREQRCQHQHVGDEAGLGAQRPHLWRPLAEHRPHAPPQRHVEAVLPEGAGLSRRRLGGAHAERRKQLLGGGSHVVRVEGGGHIHTLQVGEASHCYQMQGEGILSLHNLTSSLP